MRGTNNQMETFWHGGLSQSENNKCILTHCKDCITWHFGVRANREGTGNRRSEGDGGRLIPGLCLEDRMHW